MFGPELSLKTRKCRSKFAVLNDILALLPNLAWGGEYQQGI